MPKNTQDGDDMPMTLKKILLAVVFCSLFMPSAHATFDYRYDSKEANTGQFESVIATKLTRGVTNILFGWTEIIRTPVQMSAGIEHGALYSTIIGIPYGVFRFVGRTLVGVYEVATFYAPQGPIMPPIQGTIE